MSIAQLDFKVTFWSEKTRKSGACRFRLLFYCKGDELSRECTISLLREGGLKDLVSAKYIVGHLFCKSKEDYVTTLLRRNFFRSAGLAGNFISRSYSFGLNQ